LKGEIATLAKINISKFARIESFILLASRSNLTAAMETSLSPALRQEIRAAFEQIRDLPFPIYASDKEGVFLYANPHALDFFEISAEQNLADSRISDYYEDVKEREQIVRQLQVAAPGTWLQNLTVRLKVHENPHKVRFVSKAFFDEEKKLCALLCIALSMSDIEWFAEFEEMMMAGCFEVDSRLVIADCNRAFAKMLQFGSPAELKGKMLDDLFWEPGKAAALFEEIKQNPHLEDRQFKLRRNDGAMLIVRMNCIGIPDGSGGVARFKGTIRDVTFEIIQNDLPVGLFLVSKNQKGEEIISRATPAFAQIHGYESPEEILSKPISIFHNTPATFEAYKTELDKAAAANLPLLDHAMEILDKQGKKRNVVVNARYVADENRELRVGAVYDMTDHVRVHARTLEEDFSALLHTYIATINGLRDTLKMLMKAHGQDLLKDAEHIDRAKAAAEIVGRKKKFEEYLSELNKTTEERNLDDPQLAKLRKHWRNLSTGDIAADKEKDSASWNRLNLIEIRKSLKGLKNLNLPRELLRNIRIETDEMLRLTSIISISIAIDELNERLPEFYYFRDYLRRGDSLQQDLKTQNLVPVLLDAVRYLDEFASVNRVTVNLNFSQRDNIPVLMHKTSLNRALHSLLHNAIKYSWSKGQDRLPWVDVRLEKKQDSVEIVIENWGVPIRKEELESGSIFQFGKRGRESEDRGRSGTGIGLYDAYDIITKHGGTLRLTSEPTFGNLPEIYSNPFITKTYITLPITSEK